MTTAQCKAAGLSADRVSTLVSRKSWTRVARGVYDTRPAQPRDPDELRRRSAWTALLSFGPESIAVGQCALAMLGVEGLPVSIRPEAALPGGFDREGRRPDGLRRYERVETVTIAGRQVAAPAWALAQSIGELSRLRAVAVMDNMLFQGLLNPAGLVRARELAKGRRGVARTYEWWDLVDGRAESPLESFARVDCSDFGVPPDELQVPIVVGGVTIGRGDLGWRLPDGRWLIGEIDGREWHEAPEALYRDRARQNELVRVADVLRFTADDLRWPGKVGAAVARHLRVCRARGRASA